MQFIQPNWHAPVNIKAYSTTRQGGVSLPPFASFNLGDHVGDDPIAVTRNRELLCQHFGFASMPVFLNQTHSTNVLNLALEKTDRNADAVYTNVQNQVCIIMTADCLPVLLCNQAGTEVAAIHAGWRGLANGILENTVLKFQSAPKDIIAWLAPAISQKAFQVGTEIREIFMQKDPRAKFAFIADPHCSTKYFADLYLLAKQRLNNLGIHKISGGNYCTFSDKEKFFSYRRDKQTGRTASFIWIA